MNPDRTAGVAPRPEVCYIVPSLEPHGATHFAHLPAFLTEVARGCTLTVIAERAAPDADLPGVELIVQRYGAGPRVRRILELIALVRRLRQRGCERFFVRISTTAAVSLGMARPWLGGTLYYWTSGQARNLLPPWRTEPLERMRRELALSPLRMALRLADRVVTGPERMVGYYQRAFGVGPERCVLMYNDVDVNRFVPASACADSHDLRARFSVPKNAPLLLFVHHISYRKGCFEVAPILERLPTEVYCLMVGDGPHLPLVRQQMDERGLIPRVRLTGALPNGDLPPIYRAADIAIVPSHEEGCPRVVLEAMASGLPVVAYDVGGIRDLVGGQQQAFIVPRGDVIGFAAAVRTLLETPALRGTLQSENLERVQRFSTSRVAELFVQRIVRS